MFKKTLLVILLAVFMCTGLSYSQPVEDVEVVEVVEDYEPITGPEVLNLNIPLKVIKSIPMLKQGIIYSIDDQEIKYASTMEVVEWKGLTLEGGYVVSDTIVAVGSYNVGSLKELGVKVPILDLIEFNIGYYVGLKDINNSDQRKFDHGIAVTLLNIKF